MADKMKILALYKSLLRESEKFSTYNFRSYAIRRIQDAFKENKNLSPENVPKQIQYAEKNLKIIQRQVIIGDLYTTDKLVIEK